LGFDLSDPLGGGIVLLVGFQGYQVFIVGSDDGNDEQEHNGKDHHPNFSQILEDHPALKF
jgi:hypothetical protein